MSIRIGICSMEGIDWIDFVASVDGKGFDHIELRVGDVGEEWVGLEVDRRVEGLQLRHLGTHG